MTTSVIFDWMAEEGERLANCRHDHPFAVLGPQQYESKWIIRVWMPNADQVEILFEKNESGKFSIKFNTSLK